MLTQQLITIKVTKNKSRHNNKRHFFLHFFSLKYRNANNRHYIQHPKPSALWRELWRGQWGRLLDSEVRLWRGVLWPFMQPLWRFIPPFRMSWMCWTIKLMATARNMKVVVTVIAWISLQDKRKYYPCVVYDSCTYQDCLRRVELSHLHISLSVKKLNKLQISIDCIFCHKKPPHTRICQETQ